MMRRATDNRGSALVLALAVLGLVVAFGFAMYNASALDRLALTNEHNKDRADLDAKSGVEHAIAELQAAIASGQVDSKLNTDLEVTLNLYRLAGRAPDAAN